MGASPVILLEEPSAHIVHYGQYRTSHEAIHLEDPTFKREVKDFFFSESYLPRWMQHGSNAASVPGASALKIDRSNIADRSVFTAPL